MRGKKPTREQKIFLKSKGLNPANWLVVSDDQYRLIVMHRQSLNHKTIGCAGGRVIKSHGYIYRDNMPDWATTAEELKKKAIEAWNRRAEDGA